MNIALFTEEEINQPLSVKDGRGKHILKVLHKNVGETFDAGIINKEAGVATITKIDENFIYFDFEPKSDGKPLHPVCLIVGFPRPIQLKRLFRDVAGLGIEKLYLCGVTAPKIRDAVLALCPTFPFEMFDHLKAATEKAYNDAEDGEIVLLSPASASFDQFKNFEERGEAFRATVRETEPRA